MSYQFVNDVWFRGIEWSGRVSDVLGRKEDLVGQRGMEGLGMYQSTDRFLPETSHSL